VSAILEQLGIDATFFIELGVFFVLFAFLSRAYFSPFMKLLQERHERTVRDREAARAMLEQADAKMAEYQAKLTDARAQARAEMEGVLRQAHAEEQAILAGARDEAKKITQSALAQVEAERVRVRAALEADTELLARGIVEQLLPKGGA
jgi:F-type H+-transporting ATPase subunit b